MGVRPDRRDDELLPPHPPVRDPGHLHGARGPQGHRNLPAGVLGDVHRHRRGGVPERRPRAHGGPQAPRAVHPGRRGLQQEVGGLQEGPGRPADGVPWRGGQVQDAGGVLRGLQLPGLRQGGRPRPVRQQDMGLHARHAPGGGRRRCVRQGPGEGREAAGHVLLPERPGGGDGQDSPQAPAPSAPMASVNPGGPRRPCRRLRPGPPAAPSRRWRHRPPWGGSRVRTEGSTRCRCRPCGRSRPRP